VGAVPDFSFTPGERPTAAQWNARVRNQVITECSSSTRPASPVLGRVIYETDTKRYLVWESGQWTVLRAGPWATWTPTWTNLTIGNGGFSGRQRVTGLEVSLQGVLYFGTTTAVSGGIGFTVPNAPAVECMLQCAAFNPGASNGHTGWAGFSTTAVGAIFGPSATNAWSGTVPFTWANGARLYIAGTYPIA
jgi:hypothetical protein